MRQLWTWLVLLSESPVFLSSISIDLGQNSCSCLKQTQQLVNEVQETRKVFGIEAGMGAKISFRAYNTDTECFASVTMAKTDGGMQLYFNKIMSACRQALGCSHISIVNATLRSLVFKDASFCEALDSFVLTNVPGRFLCNERDCKGSRT